MLNICLFNPEIPQNTGNIARTCAATGTRLHIIRPMGFEIDDRKLKRAGLDYWHLLDITYYDGLDDFFEKNPGASCFFFTTKASKVYSQAEYPDGCYLFFGKETKGLPESLLAEKYDSCVRLPMAEEARDALIARFEETVKNLGGTVLSTDKWGVKKLAYLIGNKSDAFYVLMTFEADGSAIKELDRIAGITDGVLRRMITKAA